MKKWIAVTGAVLMTASTASASSSSLSPLFGYSNSRMDALGVNNWEVKDDHNVFFVPALITNYKNALYGEFGSDACGAAGTCSAESGGQNLRGAATRFGGTHMEGMGGVWGLYLGRPYNGVFNAAGTILPAGIFAAVPTNNRFDFLYGMGTGMPVGIGVTYAGQRNDTPVTDNSFGELDLNASASLMNGALDAALTFGYGTAKDKAANDEATAKALSLFLRSHRDMGGAGTLLTTLQGTWVDFGKDVDATTKSLLLDAALNCTSHQGALMIFALGASYANATGVDSVSGRTYALPATIAIEHQTFKPVKVRFGVTKALWSHTDDDTVPSKVTPDGNPTVSFGLGWQVQDNLTVDAVVNQDVLFTGTHLVSGVPETLNAKVSGAWRW